jgi:hypothetical protein
MISAAERRYLEDGVKQGLRNDGRGCFDFRPIVVETGVIPSASGTLGVDRSVEGSMSRSTRLKFDCRFVPCAKWADGRDMRRQGNWTGLNACMFYCTFRVQW